MISEKFNDFVINIGPSPADKITKQDKSPAFYLGSKIENSILLSMCQHPNWTIYLWHSENVLQPMMKLILISWIFVFHVLNIDFCIF